MNDAKVAIKLCQLILFRAEVRRTGGYDMNSVGGFEQASCGWRVSPVLAIDLVQQKVRSGR